MKLTEEKGITLVALVTTIIILLILASIGINSGMSTIENAKFNGFKTEIKLLQNKVNELHENLSESETFKVGDETNQLNEEQILILDEVEISNIIYRDKTDEEKQEIKDGFEYFNNEEIQSKLGIEGIKYNYFINIEKRFVIISEPVEYEGTNYYMLEQTNESLYNVEYNNKNSETGSFEVTTTKENNKWKIQIHDIIHEGYINNWQVKYKEENSTYWNTSDDLSFYINEDGTYYINVVHGDKVDLGTQKKVLRYPTYGTEIQQIYEQIYVEENSSEILEKTTTYDDYYDGNYKYGRSLLGALASKQELTLTETTTNGEGLEYIAAGDNEISFKQNVEQNRWIRLWIYTGYGTNSIKLSNLKLNFADGTTDNINNLVTKGYIEPLVIVSSTDNSNYLCGNSLNLLNGGNTDNSSYFTVNIFLKTKDKSNLSGLNIYSSRNFDTIYKKDGLGAYMYQQDVEISTMPFILP